MEDSKRHLKNKEQASVICNISTRSLDRLVKRKKIVPVKKGRVVRFIEGLLPSPDEARNLLKDSA